MWWLEYSRWWWVTGINLGSVSIYIANGFEIE